MIKITNLQKRYRKAKSFSLQDVNLEINQGMYGLLGANGAGKTTLIHILTTMSPKTSGEIIVNDILYEPGNYPAIRKSIGYVPQEFGMFPNMRIDEIMDYFRILNAVPQLEGSERIKNLLEYLNLSQHADKKFKHLSGGMKRRLSIGLALINDPKIIIADEPTTGVDPNERINIRNLLLDLAETKTVIMSTHIIEDISYTCKDLAVLSTGKLMFSGSIGNLLNKYAGFAWEYKTKDENETENIRKQMIVTNIMRENDGIILRILGKDIDIDGAKRIPLSLEDAFILLEGG